MRNVRQKRCITDFFQKEIKPESVETASVCCSAKIYIVSVNSEKYDIFSLQTMSLLSDLDMH